MALRRNRAAEENVLPHGAPPETPERARLTLVTLAFLAAFTIIAFKLHQVHLNPHLELTREERTHIGELVLKAERGAIYDRNAYPLATDAKAPSLWVDPRKVEKADELALLLAARLGLDEQTAFERLTRRTSDGRSMKFVWLKRWLADVPQSVLSEIEEAGGGAIGIREESLRFYPQGDTAAHLLGFVNREGVGSEGAEALHDSRLRGEAGVYRARTDIDRRLLSSLTLEHQKANSGDDLYLTIDSTIQHDLEEALDRRIEECNASRGMGLLMDPDTGAILALATRPAFNPNQFEEAEAELRKNSAVIDVFEPGSAFKIVTAAAALEYELVQTDTIIDCEGGYFNPYGHTISDFHKFDEIPFAKCFEESSNIALIKLAALLGPARLEEWILRFGFGQATSPDFPYESRGIFRPRDKWSRLSMGSLPMGQEIAVTMPQLAKAFAVIANGGYVVEPYYVEKAVNEVGEVTWRHEPPETMRILSGETARTMQELCYRVVRFGTGDDAAIPEYRVGGKTGTAQMALKDGRGYSADRYTTVFAGFAPVADPRVVAVIVVQEPMIRLHYGGYVCGPVFAEVVRKALVHLDVPKDPMPPKEDEAAEEAASQLRLAAAEDADTVSSPLEAVFTSPEQEGQLAPSGEAMVALEAPEAIDESLQALLEPLDGLQLVAQHGDVLGGGRGLPNFEGMTKLEAQERLAELAIPWDMDGAGWVVAQEPPPGTPLDQVGLCLLRFGPRAALAEGSEDDEQRGV